MLITTKRAKALMNAVIEALLPHEGFWTRPDGWAYHGYLCGHIWVWPCGRQWLVDIDSIPPHIEAAVRSVLPERWQEEPTDALPLPFECAPKRLPMRPRSTIDLGAARRPVKTWKAHRAMQARV